MSAHVDGVVRAVLYEGYVLYPYRPSSLKNRRRFPFGAVFPPAFCRDNAHDACEVQCEVLVRGARPHAAVAARFLQLRDDSRSAWQEAEERVVRTTLALSEVTGATRAIAFHFAGSRDLNGVVEVSASRVADDVSRLRVRIRNETAFDGGDREEATLRSLASTHAVIEVDGGELVSLMDPPDDLHEAARACANVGLWPVLVGEAGSNAAMLASPIILYDHPRVAPESPGDLFDATEIDEILTLRILTLADDERREILAAGGRARALLERTDALGEAEIARLHGAVRSRASRPTELRPGDRVRLHPRRRADVFDVALAGRAATIATIEEDLVGALLFTVTIDDDPGKDLGAEGLPGHRFFFHPDEVEKIA